MEVAREPDLNGEAAPDLGTGVHPHRGEVGFGRDVLEHTNLGDGIHVEVDLKGEEEENIHFCRTILSIKAQKELF